MLEPVPATAHSPLVALARLVRLAEAIDALSGAIAGFALLAGTRAFMFASLLGWRDPVLGGAGLMLLAVIGWLRWRFHGEAAVRVRCSLRGSRNLAEQRKVACYNRLPGGDSVDDSVGDSISNSLRAPP
jgi:hypothetical protein